jgi:bifunctional DNA-binding transcriptional regulator/antitoxin component of YhaV-PrlF toxin-antitoxin module
METARAYEQGNPDSLIVVIPSRIRKKHQIKKGTVFIVKTDDEGRIIYTPIKET